MSMNGTFVDGLAIRSKPAPVRHTNWLWSLALATVFVLGASLAQAHSRLKWRRSRMTRWLLLTLVSPLHCRRQVGKV